MKIGPAFHVPAYENLVCDAQSVRFSVLGCGTEISALTARVCISVGCPKGPRNLEATGDGHENTRRAERLLPAAEISKSFGSHRDGAKVDPSATFAVPVALA